jgi:hypothetical protein
MYSVCGAEENLHKHRLQFLSKAFVMKCDLRITHYALRITYYALRITHYKGDLL